MSKTILVLPGDGIGPEITEQAVKVIQGLIDKHSLDFTLTHGYIGGAGYDHAGHPLPEATMQAAYAADAILLGAVGGPQYDTLDRPLRPEQGLLGLRKNLSLFANLRPAILYPQLAHASTLKPEVVSGLDILIVRELTGDIYFGQPRGVRVLENGEKEGYNTAVYRESEIQRIAHVAFQAAQKRQGRVCSIDKSNVMEVTQLWKDTVTEVAQQYPDVELSHMLVDNAAMQLVKNPKQFDVMLTGNMFGDILSDEASMLTGSIGMLPSASLNGDNKGMYEPSHGSAPDIAGQNKANPLATILSAAMMFRFTFARGDVADAIEQACMKVLDQGLRTGDIMSPGMTQVSCSEMGDAVVAALD